MKKIFLFAAFIIMLTSCGVGTYSVQSGVEDAAFISFTDDEKQEIVFPGWIDVIREVTGDPAYSNYELARIK